MPSPRARGGAGRPNQSPTAIHRFSRYCTQHHQPATTTEQYSPLIALPAYACPVTFLADTFLSLAWTRETRCIPCRHMYSINWRHCTGTKKKTKDQGMLFSRSALLPRSLRRMVKILKSIHGTHGKIMKNRPVQIHSF